MCKRMPALIVNICTDFFTFWEQAKPCSFEEQLRLWKNLYEARHIALADYQETRTSFVALEEIARKYTLSESAYLEILLTHEAAHSHHYLCNSSTWREYHIGEALLLEGLAVYATVTGYFAGYRAVSTLSQHYSLIEMAHWDLITAAEHVRRVIQEG